MPTFIEEIVEEQRLKIFLLLESGSDVFQKHTLEKLYQTLIENRGISGHTLMMQPPRHIRAIPA